MRYNGAGNVKDEAQAISISLGNNILVTGYSYGGSTNLDCATLKLNKCGDILWVNRYDYWFDFGYDVTADIWGRAIVGGIAQQDIYYFKNQFLVLKYGSSGNQMWYIKDGPYGDDAVYKVAVDNSGNIYAAGITCIYDEPNHTMADFVLLKYNENGVPQWSIHYGLPHLYDRVWDMTLDQDGYIYITGSSDGEGTGTDWATLKYDENGNSLWNPPPRYNGTANAGDEPRSIAVDNTGNVYVTGYSTEYEIPPGGGDGTWTNMTTIKYNTEGTQVWINRYIGTGSEKNAWGNSVTLSNNEPVASGWVHQFENEYQYFNDFVIIKYYVHNGSPAWTRFYANVAWGNDEAIAAKSDQNGNIYVTGRCFSENFNWGSYDIATIKFAPNGERQWVMTYNGPDNSVDEPIDLAIDGDAVYTTGRSFSQGHEYDYITVKYSPSWLPLICDDEKMGSEVLPGLRNIAKLNDSSAIAVGEQGRINITQDKGLNWRNILTQIQVRFNTIHFNNSNGIIAGENGILLYTSNSGNNWLLRATPSAKEIKSVQCVSSNTIYCAGENGLLLKSTNSGLTWLDLLSDTTIDLNCIFFINSSKGFVVGSNGIILTTTNSGLNWRFINLGTTKELNKIFFKDSENGVIVGETGTLLLTSNGGNNWVNKEIGYSNDLNSAYFVNNMSVYVSGNSGLILHSTDMGLTWEREQSYLRSDITDVTFLDSAKGIAITADGKIALTSKGEISYNEPLDNSTKIFNFSNYIQNTDYQLFQNYPNPFNPTTEIKYYLHQDNRVMLNVYDITGKLVSVLVDGHMSEGMHSAIYDASNVASGIYFYKLSIFSQNGLDIEHTVSKKMVIIK